MRKRIYFIETNEPFDVPASKVGDLVLSGKFSQSPVDKTAEPAVQDAEKPYLGTGYWVEQNLPEESPKPKGRGRRSRARQEAAQAESWRSESDEIEAL